ncbi:MAG: SUMF1/EgtB/PvdO family nonheme iron enzyme [Proteobacteria bacterium]|nr:SUMF1/EgtB/PvdO family nonheme iron enzyme [Pseudomonadota bacterium]
MDIDWITIAVGAAMKGLTGPPLGDASNKLKGMIQEAFSDGPLSGPLKSAFKEACKGFHTSLEASFVLDGATLHNLQKLARDEVFVGALDQLPYLPFSKIDTTKACEAFRALGPPDAEDDDFKAAWRALGRRFQAAVAKSEELKNFVDLTYGELEDKRGELIAHNSSRQVELLEELLDAIKDKDGVDSKAPLPDLESQIEQYLAKGITEYESISLTGFETRVRVPIQLEDLYVPLDAMVDLRIKESDKPFQCADEAEELRHERMSREVPLAEAFECAREYGNRRSVVILGDPGSGKTTHMKRLFLAVAKHGSEKFGLPQGTIPIFLPLRNLKDTSGNLHSFIESELAEPYLDLSLDFGRHLLDRGKLLLLFDGLDEVIDANMREQVSRWIEKVRITVPDSYLAVTCRYAGYTGRARLSEQFLEMNLRPLNDEQASKFISNWFRIVETSMAKDKDQARIKADKQTGKLLAELQKSDVRASARVFAMTRNPLLLTTICLVHRDRGSLPRRRAELYDECVNVLLERWRKAKDLTVTIPAASARRVLQPVAYWMHGEQDRRRATADELAPVIEPVLGKIQERIRTAGDFLRSIRDESGLLTGWSGDSYGFMHLGFQEYLAALEIRSKSFEDPVVLKELAERFGESWWREVVLLLVAVEGRTEFESFMRYVVDTPMFAENIDLARQCLDETVEVSLEPFYELLKRPPKRDQELWERQLATLTILESRDPKKMFALSGILRKHPSKAIQSWFRSREFWAGKDVITNKPSGIELVRIPGGEFMMGSPENEKGRDKDEGPRHKVTVGEFDIGRYPVTNEEYGRYLKDNPEAKEPKHWGDSKYNQSSQPVVGVSWNDAKQYCEWAGLRLPSEAEWEYACRAWTTTRYCSGDKESDLDRVGWYNENSDGRLHPVGEKEPNKFGLYDMHGNVWEWCEDDWHDDYKGAPKDGSSWIDTPRGRVRVRRGGSFNVGSRYARCAYRERNSPVGGDFGGRSFGFRVVSSPFSHL